MRDHFCCYCFFALWNTWFRIHSTKWLRKRNNSARVPRKYSVNKWVSHGYFMRNSWDTCAQSSDSVFYPTASAFVQWKHVRRRRNPKPQTHNTKPKPITNPNVNPKLKPKSENPPSDQLSLMPREKRRFGCRLQTYLSIGKRLLSIQLRISYKTKRSLVGLHCVWYTKNITFDIDLISW